MEGSSTPIRRSRARTQAAANQIRHQVLSGAWADGHLLPSERDMAAQFGIARNTLRRILRQLEAEGLIENQPGRGSLVRLSPLGDQMSRAEIFSAPRMAGTASHADLLELGALLEPLVAEVAASRATPEDIAAMESALRNATDAKEQTAFEHWHGVLRLVIWRAARNTALLDWYDVINRSRGEHRVTAPLRVTDQRDMAAIVAAVRNRNPDLARELMREHLTRARDSHSLMPV
jgi:GntR family transcriptional repressor for pyruvate dehydrogenase complex